MGQVEQLAAIQAEQTSKTETELFDALSKSMYGIADRFAQTGNPNPPDSMGGDIEAVLLKSWGLTIRASGLVVQEDIEGGKKAETLFERLVQAFIEQYGAAKVQSIVDATRNQMIRLIAQGIKDGGGVQAIAQLMREYIPQLSRLRAHVIARTETHTASMFASQETAKQTGRELMKEWVPVQDARTRDFGEGDGVVDTFSHRAMAGARVALDQPYMVPTKAGLSEALMFPGDPNGSAGNVINCRCAQTYRRVR